MVANRDEHSSLSHEILGVALLRRDKAGSLMVL